ncbi:hypothetical protein DRN97_00120 [Methanosarcinales archaeon]|nr:MAG: hypothetical protein DRN97_00120 [Methanosarcinales archaeon]
MMDREGELKRKKGRKASDVKIERLTVSLPLRLLQLFDSVIKEQGYATKSEAIRDLLRVHIEKHISGLRHERDTKKMGVVVYILPAEHSEHKQTLIAELMECEAKFRDVACSVSTMIDGNKMMRVATVKGSAKRIAEFKNAVEALKDVTVIGTSGWRVGEAKVNENP